MPSPDDSAAEQFGPYEVYERLGVGGMATVHRAKQHGIEGVQRTVALKRLLPHLAEDSAFIKSFVREAKLALALHHANIVQLFELGKVGNVYFIAMEYIDGRDVRQLLRHARKVSGPPTINVTLSLLIQACEALEYAHTHCDDRGAPLGLVHRDVSPSNLMVTRSGHLKIIDFGIAKAQTQQLRTQTGKVKGKLAYMAPESTLGRELDSRSDLFSIGIIAHELLTARPLFAAKTDYQTILNVQQAELVPPSAFNQAVPPELDAIVLRALARDPDQRYHSAAELRDDLHGVRIRYQLSATNREVQAWTEWAFSLEAPGASFSGMAPSWSGIRTPAPTASRLPIRPAVEPRPDDEAAAIAWGGGDRDVEPDSDDDADADAVPDYGHRAVAARRSSARIDTPATATPTAGGMVDRAATDASGAHAAAAQAPRGGGAVKLALGFMLVAVLAAIVFVARDRFAGGTAGSRGQAVAAESATLKFIVEPTDATIKIAGLELHQGTPWTIELEPGVVQIKISQPAFTSWETSIELSARETQTIRVVLSPAAAEDVLATVLVSSDPPGLTAVLDGHALPDRTPLKLKVEPGPHTLALMEGGQVVWSQTIDAEARTQYEFSPSMSDAKRREREARIAADRARAPGPVHAASARVAPVVRATPDAGLAVAVAVAPAAAPIDAGVAPMAVAPPRAVDAGVVAAVVAPRAVDAGVVAVAAPTRAVVVPPTAVHRTSGSLPKIKTIVRPGQEAPTAVSVKICIDTSGRVSSVVIYKLSGDVADALESAIRTWRYSPYLVGGAPTAACFVNPFALK